MIGPDDIEEVLVCAECGCDLSPHEAGSDHCRDCAYEYGDGVS